MHLRYTCSAIVASLLVFSSFSTNPPDGNTGAPGDQLCVQCHTQTNPAQDGVITLEGFPATITPNQTYMLTVTNRVTVDTAVRGGFQVTILGPFNTRAGEIMSPSVSSAVSIFNNRQYWDHNPAREYPDSNVVRWTALWKAPEMPAGSVITWYAAGNIADGNFQNTGDRIVTSQGSGSIVMTGIEETNDAEFLMYPNPGSDFINVTLKENTQPNGTLSFYNLLGVKIGEEQLIAGKSSIDLMPSGVYLVEIKTGEKAYILKWSKL